MKLAAMGSSRPPFTARSTRSRPAEYLLRAAGGAAGVSSSTSTSKGIREPRVGDAAPHASR